MKTPQKPAGPTPNREAAIGAAKARDYMIGYELMVKRYEDGWYRLADKIGTPAIDDRNPFPNPSDQGQGFEDAKARLFHLS